MKIKKQKHNGKCKIEYDPYNGDYDCGYCTKIYCSECKYGNHGGRKDPNAKINEN